MHQIEITFGNPTTSSVNRIFVELLHLSFRCLVQAYVNQTLAKKLGVTDWKSEGLLI